MSIAGFCWLRLLPSEMGGDWTFAQGCVAAHSNQRPFDELLSTDSGHGVSLGQTNNWMHNLTVDSGYRVFNLLGESNGFRRPGFIFSFDPGLMFSYKRDTLSVNGPWALYRDRPPSVPDIQYKITNGDAFFAGYTVIVNLSHHF